MRVLHLPKCLRIKRSALHVHPRFPPTFQNVTCKTVEMEELWLRVVQNMAARLDGPLHLRFILQPSMAIVLALRDGLQDARNGEPPYLWSVFADRVNRIARLKKGWRSIGKVFVVALGIDGIYQMVAFRFIYVGEALLTASLLAIVPYALLRGPFNRVARRGSPSDITTRRLRSVRS
jgi:hypothetical protein